MKRFLLLGLVFCLLACCASALAASARVLTPGGKLKMRRDADAKAKVVVEIPNRTLVDVEAVEGEWARVTYKKKTGYVKTEFLLLPQNMVGRQVYSDGEILYLYTAPSADAPLAGAVSPSEAVTVEETADDWALVSCGGMRGYTQTAGLTYQYAEAQAGPAFLRESAVTLQETALRLRQDESSSAAAVLPLGTPVTVTVLNGSRCLVLVPDAEGQPVCGWAESGAISLIAPEDEAVTGQAVSVLDAVDKASAALKKKIKAFASASLYTSVALTESAAGISGPLYRIAWLNDADQFRYGALVSASDGKVLFTADYGAFAAPSKAALLPRGEMNLTLGAEALAVGEVLTVDVEAWTSAKCRYALTRDGAKVFSGEDVPYFTAAYRPRQEGQYTLTVTVTDAEGLSASRSADFTVQGTGTYGQEEVFSQKDGWWLNKEYRKSTLDKSGCAIFTLSHALDRMGYEGEEILPEQLAKTFALCLTVDGTNNERLIREAGQAFGFGTKADLLDDKKQIAEKLREGAFFSFSIVRGHIALITGLSDDGQMVHVVDSAPSATIERIVNGALYVRRRSGSWKAVLSLDEIPGARYYFDTQHFGGLSYWMELNYAARRGVRLIEPQKP